MSRVTKHLLMWLLEFSPGQERIFVLPRNSDHALMRSRARESFSSMKTELQFYLFSVK